MESASKSQIYARVSTVHIHAMLYERIFIGGAALVALKGLRVSFYLSISNVCFIITSYDHEQAFLFETMQRAIMQ